MARSGDALEVRRGRVNLVVVVMPQGSCALSHAAFLFRIRSAASVLDAASPGGVQCTQLAAGC